MTNVIKHQVKINNPIGNLYRKKHILILVQTSNGNFVLGKKKNFYPDHISRMLGGGAVENEDPIKGAAREILEETKVDQPLSSFTELCTIITQATTTEGYMELETSIFFTKIDKVIAPSDDITGVEFLSEPEYKKLIQEMYDLKGEYKGENFTFEWADWGQIHGFIHEKAYECYLKVILKL